MIKKSAQPGSLRYWVQHHQSLVVGCFVLVVYLLHLNSLRNSGFPYDGSQYWQYAGELFASGHFSLSTYTSLLRGPIWPMLLAPAARAVQLGWISQPAAMNLLGATMAAVLTAGVAPALWQAAIGRPLGWWRRLGFAALVFLFWRDNFSQPLSDFPGVLLLLGSALLAGRRYAGSKASVLAALGAGVLLAAAVNVRPVYLPTVVVVTALLWWRLGPGPSPGLGLSAARLGVFVAGLVLASIPQMLVNHNLSNSWSPLGQTQGADYMVAGKPNLYLWQLNHGLSIQKYETNIGQDYPSAPVNFLDPVGAAVLQKNQVAEFPTLGAYLQAALHQPADFAALYARHLFNGLDVQYPRVYVTRIYKSAIGLALINYTLWFAALLVVFWAWRPPAGAMAGIALVLAALLLPSAAAIPTVIECRFLVPLHLIIYALVAFGWPAAWSWRQWARSPMKWQLVGVYFLFLLGCVTLSASVQANLQHGPRLLNP